MTEFVTLRRHDRNRGGRFAATDTAQYRGMDVKKPLLVLALLGSLVACGDNSDLQRGETNCDSSAEDASNPHDASCEETGTNDDVG